MARGSVREILAGLALRLEAAGVPRARAEARLLVGAALGWSVGAVVARDTQPLEAEQLAAIEAVAVRRLKREPMAHILGQREFFGRSFAVSGNVLTPRPESELLVDVVLERVRARPEPLRLLDLGVGSGCLLLTLLAELPTARGVGVDASGPALAIAAENARSLGVADRAELVAADWTAEVTGQFDVIVSNPPYIATADIGALEPEVACYEPRLALDGGADGLDAYRALVRRVPDVLAPQALLALEVGAGQADLVASMLATQGLRVLQIRNDLAGIARCVLGTTA